MSVQARCSCGYYMQLPDDWAGKQGRCPQCSKILSIPESRAARHSAHDRSASSRLTVNQQLDGEIDLTSSDAVQDRTSKPWRNPIWITLVAAGIGLVAIGLFLVLRPNTKHLSDDHASGLADDGTQLSRDAQTRVFRPQIRSDQADEPVGSPQPQTSTIPPELGGYKAPAVAAVKDSSTGTSIDSCSMRDFGVFVPPGASVIEIDGVALPVRNPAELTRQGAATLVLPLGKHIVRFSKSDVPRVVEPKRWFSDAYREATAAVQENGRWNFDRLLDQSRRTLDRFAEPLVPHYWGNYYWQEGELDAAARHYTWALEITPTFAPSYFNLAALAHERNQDAAAHRYLRLADLWNAQNAYGLSAALAQLRAVLAEPVSTVEPDEPDWYASNQEALTTRDRDMAVVMHSAAEFCTTVSERAKILNNLGAYFEYVGKSDRALESYRSAAAVLGTAKLSIEERRVIHGILDNLARVCRKADMPEYRRYERLQAMME